MIPSKLISRRGIAVVPSTVLEPDPDQSARLLDLRRCHRIGAVIGGVKGARPVVARKADAAEWGVRGRAVGRAVPVDHAGAHIGPEPGVKLRRNGQDRTSVVSGKSGSVRGGFGGRRRIK